MFARNYYDTGDFFGFPPGSLRKNLHYYDSNNPNYYYIDRRHRREQDRINSRNRLQRQVEEYNHYQQQLAAELERLRWERQKRNQKQKQRRQALSFRDEDEDDNDNYEIGIVRGSDGNLYYVQKPIVSQSTRNLAVEPREQYNYNDDDDVSSVLSDADVDDEDYDDGDDDGDKTFSSSESDAEEDAFLARLPQTNAGAAPVARRVPSTRKPKKKQRTITITVEDASDSECESEYDSPWRNRRPSPGQWIEPVESYYIPTKK